MVASGKKEKAEHFNITIPVELLKKIRGHPEVNWSRVATKAFERHLQTLELLEQIAEPGITDEEAARRVIETRNKLLTEKLQRKTGLE